MRMSTPVTINRERDLLFSRARNRADLQRGGHHRAHNRGLIRQSLDVYLIGNCEPHAGPRLGLTTAHSGTVTSSTLVGCWIGKSAGLAPLGLCALLMRA